MTIEAMKQALILGGRGMTRDDIIELVREADIDWHQHWVIGEDENRLERFAHLVAAAERQRNLEMVQILVEAEREACAQVAENGLIGLTIAKAIRARGEK